jgi:hypothetical protein
VSIHSQGWDEQQQNNSALRLPHSSLQLQHHQRRHQNSRLASPSNFDFAAQSQSASSNTFLQPGISSSFPQTGGSGGFDDYTGTGRRIENYLDDPSAPWTELSMSSVRAPRRIPSSLHPPRATFTAYRSAPGSDNGSSGAGQNASDSGYISRSAESHTSHNDPKSCSQETEVQEIPTQLEGFRPFTPSGGTMQNKKSTPVAERPQSRASSSQIRERLGQQKCPHCTEIPKCPSDLK